jgi:hypothetical protein
LAIIDDDEGDIFEEDEEEDEDTYLLAKVLFEMPVC